jgi:hypothetical protein
MFWKITGSHFNMRPIPFTMLFGFPMSLFLCYMRHNTVHHIFAIPFFYHIRTNDLVILQLIYLCYEIVFLRSEIYIHFSNGNEYFAFYADFYFSPSQTRFCRVKCVCVTWVPPDYWWGLCQIARSSVILLLPLFIAHLYVFCFLFAFVLCLVSDVACVNWLPNQFSLNYI